MRDPLRSPWVSTLFFGGVFIVGFVVNLFKLLLGARGAGGGTDPSALAMLLGWLVFAVLSGFSVAFVRRRFTSSSRQNLATGVVVGFLYAAVCAVTFGRSLGVGLVVLVAFVWGATAWAVTSSLNELAGASRPR